MADIRIKDLATTASSTASDDFLAVDGTTNGTRKLNAYSPTFGGNLTVSGTGTSSVAGTFGIGTASTLGTLNVATPNLTYGTVYLNGATTTADFMRLKSTGADGVFGIESSGGGTILTGSTANSTVLYSVGATALHLGTSGTTRATLTSGGNVLIGTTTDSSNGKLQLATHTTSAGGIGFGTDTSLFRVGGGELALDGVSGNSPAFTLKLSGVSKSMLFNASGNTYLDTLTAGASIILRSGNATTALTLDSSQNATFNGQVTITPEAGLDSYIGYSTNRDTFLTCKAAGSHYLRDATGAIWWQFDRNKTFIVNTTSAPASNPSGGGYLYVESGALKYRGSSGTITPIAPA